MSKNVKINFTPQESSKKVKMSKFKKIISSKIKKDSIRVFNFILKRDNFTTNFFKRQQNAATKNV